MPHSYVEKNIAITPKLIEYMHTEGYDTGIGLSRERTIYGESWREWFSTKADVQTVIEIFTMHDPQLHYDGIHAGAHIIKNGDRRLAIRLKEDQARGITHVWVQYIPNRWSLDRSI